MSRRAEIEAIEGFLGWFSLDGIPQQPPIGAKFCFENDRLGCAFSRNPTSQEKDAIYEAMQELAPSGDHMWDGSQVGWQLHRRAGRYLVVRDVGGQREFVNCESCGGKTCKRCEERIRKMLAAGVPVFDYDKP